MSCVLQFPPHLVGLNPCKCVPVVYKLKQFSLSEIVYFINITAGFTGGFELSLRWFVCSHCDSVCPAWCQQTWKPHYRWNHVSSFQTYCFVMVVSSFQLKNAFNETGYPAFYRWEQSLKEMKWFCPPITILT